VAAEGGVRHLPDDLIKPVNDPRQFLDGGDPDPPSNASVPEALLGDQLIDWSTKSLSSVGATFVFAIQVRYRHPTMEEMSMR
jgi:hypothetical protein